MTDRGGLLRVFRNHLPAGSGGNGHLRAQFVKFLSRSRAWRSASQPVASGAMAVLSTASDAMRVTTRIVRMVESGDRARFALEPGAGRRNVGVARVQDLHRDRPAESRVVGAVHFTQAACTKQRHDFVGAQAGAWCNTH